MLLIKCIFLIVLCNLFIVLNVAENTHEKIKCRRWYYLLSEKKLYPASGFFLGHLIHRGEKAEEIATVTVIHSEWAITLGRPFLIYGNNTDHYGINHFSNNYIILIISIHPEYTIESNNKNVALLKINSQFCYHKDFGPIIKSQPLRLDYYKCAILRYGSIYQYEKVVEKLGEVILPESDCSKLLIKKPATMPKAWCHVIDDPTCDKDTGAPITCDLKDPNGKFIQALLAPPINGTSFSCKRSVEDFTRLPSYVVDLGRVYSWIQQIVSDLPLDQPLPKTPSALGTLEL